MQMIFSDHTENVQWYRSYTATMKEELADLMDSDQSLYRVDKTFPELPCVEPMNLWHWDTVPFPTILLPTM